MPYVDLPTGPAYHEVSGSGEPLILLHGGFCSLEAMRDLNERLAEGFEVHAVERPGHGRTADVPGPYSFAAMTRHTLDYLDALALPRAHVVGFSDGAITGLLLARDHPSRVTSLVAISANLDPSGFVPDEEAAASMSPQQHERLTREFGELSPDGPDHAAVVEGKLVDLWGREPRIPLESLASLRTPALVMAGERDLISAEHTETIARGIPGAGLCIVPDTGHLLVRERPGLIAAVIRPFLEGI